MKLNHKLQAAFAALLLLSSGASLVGIYMLNQSNNAYLRLIQVNYEDERKIAQMQIDFKSQVQEWKDTLLRGKDEQMRSKYWTAFQKHEHDVAVAAKALQDDLAPGAARDSVAQFAEAHGKMGVGYRHGFEAFTAANFDSAAGDASVKGMDRGPTQLLSAAREQLMEETRSELGQSREYARRANQISVLLMIAMFGVGVGAGIIISRKLVGALTEAIGIAKIVAAGDLNSDIVVTSSDETGELLGALKEMNQRLREIVGRVRRGTESIALATNEIAAGSRDLSSRTEQQASSLEETAASMEELATTVKQNADSARQATELAVSASDVAVKGNAVVFEVVETMGAINDSARRIAEITGVIDGIAFQTNILALNAAVEAARAGEQGRGFAVVASEVRTLAQRSAAAAKEINILIAESVEQVKTGSRLADQAGSTMADVVASVRRVTDIIGEIAVASRGQEQGIAEINRAVSDMDEATQQNSTMVEQATAASEALQEQSAGLLEAVSIFKITASHTQKAGGRHHIRGAIGAARA